jgi:hypothetical protein
LIRNLRNFRKVLMELEQYEVVAGNALYHDGQMAEVGQVIELTPEQAVTHGQNIKPYQPVKGDLPKNEAGDESETSDEPDAESAEEDSKTQATRGSRKK